MFDLLVCTDRRLSPIVARAHWRRRRFVRRVTRHVLRHFLRMVANKWRTIAEQRTRRRLVDELLTLDDVILADIGIHRSDIVPTVETLTRRRRIANDVTLALHASRLRPSDLTWVRAQQRTAPATRWPRNDNVGTHPTDPLWRNAR